MTMEETVAAIQRADLWALLAPIAVSFVASVVIFLVRRKVLERTSFRLLTNVLAAIALVATVALSLISYEQVSTSLVARALRPMAVANAKYLGNPDRAARTEARQRASSIVGNRPVDPLQFSCHYPGWSIPAASMLTILFGALIVRQHARVRTVA
jgi:phosphoglycerol transferase MdoB-like AlkP superfamily enzyme